MFLQICRAVFIIVLDIGLSPPIHPPIPTPHSPTAFFLRGSKIVLCRNLKTTMMKPFILLIGVTITSLFAIRTADKNISGTWIMKQGDNPDQPPVLHIEMGEGIWQGKLDIPEQEVYGRKIRSIRVDGDSVFITVYKNGSTIYARKINDSSIIGIMKSDSRTDTVKLKKM